MVLSSAAIRQAMRKGLISIEPFIDEQVDCAHVDLHLEDKDGDEAGQILAPTSFTILRTREKLTLAATICGFFDGRASLAKQGISVHQASAFVEPGTDSVLTLEVFNANTVPYVVKGGQKIGKIVFMLLTDVCP